MEKDKTYYMNQAIKQAEKGRALDEVPVGAVIVLNGRIIARACNKKETLNLCTAHAEILAIEKAEKKLKTWHLDDAEMYVTLEPCPMCAGAITGARIKKVYFGAYEPKSGSAVSKFPLLTESGLNHKTEFEGGILGEKCSLLIKNYFKNKRQGQID